MKKLFVLLLEIVVCCISAPSQTIFEVDGICYKVLTEADDATTFGTVEVVPKENGFYEGEINIPNGVKNSKEQYADSYKVIAISDKAFQDCTSLTKVHVSASVEKIGQNAFAGCNSLETVTFAKGNLVSLGREVFKDSGIKQIDIPEGVTEIPWIAFAGCKNLSQISLPSSVKTLGCSAFSGCSSLRTISLPESLREIMLNCFGGSGIEEIVIPSKIRVLPDMVFGNCHNLKKIVLSPETQKIEDQAFLLCTSLKEIVLPNSVVSIGDGAFHGCKSLQKVVFSKNLKTIGYMAFGDCSSLTEKISLPEGLKL